jgi:hypothetical protein
MKKLIYLYQISKFLSSEIRTPSVEVRKVGESTSVSGHQMPTRPFFAQPWLCLSQPAHYALGYGARKKHPLASANLSSFK